MAPGSLAPGSDCELGIGIAVADEAFGDASSRSASALVGFNEVRDAVFGGILAVGESRMVRIAAVHNSVRAYFHQSTMVSAIESIVTGGEFGIGLLGRAKGEVRDNVIQGSTSGPVAGPSFFVGIAIGQAFVPSGGHNGPIDIHDNIVRRVVYGAYVVDADQVTFRRNQVTNTYYGVWAQATTDSGFRRNTIAAKYAGLLLLSGSADNQVVSNAVSGVGGFCIDDSSGSGTAGTDNHWADNTATAGSNPSGICNGPI